MKRIQLFEFEDQTWFGPSFRVALTKLLAVLNKVTKLHEVLAIQLEDFIKETGEKKLLDYGSGSGGAMPDTYRILVKSHPELKLTLSDLYPDPRYTEIYNSTDDGITYTTVPVDASSIAEKHDGIKTLVNSFHHLPPEMAKKVLSTAQQQGDPILIYEMAENKIPKIVWWLGLPIGLALLVLSALIMTPFVKKPSLHQLFFTYVIPVIPLCYAWDGQASLPRIYTKEDIEFLLDKIGSIKGYTWEIKPAINSKNKKQGYVIIGKSTT